MAAGSLAAGWSGAARAALPPASVIVVGGGLTEIVYAMGAGDLVLATDSTSMYPPAANETRKVGYQRSLSAEGLLSLRPRLVILAPEAGPPAAIQQLSQSGTRVIRTTERHDFEGLLERVRVIGDALERGDDAQRLAARLRDEWADVQREVAGRRQGSGAPRAPRVVFVLSHAGAPMVAGRQTAADAMISLAGAVNPLHDGFAGYRPMTPEALLLAAPDILLTTNEGIAANGGVPGILAKPGVAVTPAGRAGRIIGRDALPLIGFGPRLPEVVRDLSRTFAGAGADARAGAGASVGAGAGAADEGPAAAAR
ncbi:MAG: ABC transporter substrate-binding protein [Burkholderiaceae bacterium]